MEALVDGVQARVAHRISRLEEEVSMHSESAMTELRACSMRTEASIERLAGSLDRLLTARPAFPAVGTEPEKVSEAPEVKAAAAATGERPARSRGWGLFS